MKKIISIATFLSVVLISVISLTSLPYTTRAQNIGSLRNVVTSEFSFKKDLMFGDTDPDVKELQKVLNADIDTMIVSDEAGSKGKESTYFGDLTKVAVIKFQNKYKDIVLTLNSITSANGIVNKATRTRLNLLIGVVNTYDSVGLPQSRASVSTPSTPVTYVAPTVVVAAPQPQMNICSFVDLLINIGAISSSNSARARSVLGCQAAFVDLKVNGQNGPVSLILPQNVTLTWTSSGVTSCTSGNTDKPVSGSQVINMTAQGIFRIVCTGPGGVVSDSVTVDDANSSRLILGASVIATTTKATFTINTNRAAVYKLYYGDTVATISNVTLPGQNTTATYELTNLTSNKKYYYKVFADDLNGFTTETNIGDFTTLSGSSTVAVPPRILSDYVLPSTTTANFIVSTDKVTEMAIFYGDDNQQSPIMVRSVATTTLWRKEVTGLTPDTTYHYQIIVVDSGGLSSSSTLKTFRTLIGATTTENTYKKASTTEEEVPAPINGFGGVVTRVTKCSESESGENLTEIVIDSCPGSPTAEIDSTYVGERNSAGQLTGQIKVMLPNDTHELPNVGDAVLGEAVPDLTTACSALVGGVTVSSAEYVGTITGDYGHEPGGCSSAAVTAGEGGGSTHHWYQGDYFTHYYSGGVKACGGVSVIGTICGVVAGYVGGVIGSIFGSGGIIADIGGAIGDVFGW